MVDQLRYLYGFFLLFGLGLSACSGSANRTDDITPLSADVVTQVTAAVPVEAPPSTPAAEVETPSPSGDTTVLSFTISGGAVGFCDELAINPEGEYTLRICEGQALTGKLSQSDRASLQAWYQNLSDISLNFEDEGAGGDKLKTSLIFDGQGEVVADERQQRVIYDWVNGLVVRLRPQQLEPTPTAEPIVTSPEGICPDIGHPALLTLNIENPATLVLVDPGTQATCNIPLSRPPAGRVVTLAGGLFYPVFDPEAKTLTVWHVTPAGEQVPLSFTAVPMEEPGPFDFVISGDGTRIAWSHTILDLGTDPPLYYNNLWLAKVDGSDLITLLDQVENSEQRFVAPIRFAIDGSSLYYALQPDLGGSFNGRYDNLYQVSLAGGESELLYACNTAENPVCVGGLSSDGSLYTVIQPAEGSLQLLDREGNLVNSFILPASDYIERTAFSPGGQLAFVSAALTEGSEEAPPMPNPGYVSWSVPPHTGSLQTLLEDNRVGSLMGWLDENRLVFTLIGEEGQPTTALLTTEGAIVEVSLDIAVAVWP